MPDCDHKILLFYSCEGGRAKPVLSGYIQKLHAATWSTTFRLDLPASGGTEMILPGEQATIKVIRRREPFSFGWPPWET